MFESHFGLSAPPFQLNPDPTFYFGSKGHSNALAYLQYGVHQAEGFIVVTGEIGAGKTTLVRTLLEGLDSSQVKAAQIASTQLDATGLLQAMLTAFGVPPPPGPTSKANLISTLEAFFMTLAIKNKRALLVVDEAQNLSMEAIEELRMLSNFQLRKQALLQSFLVGQPELRTMLESQRLEQLRQRVIASCHLGPLDLEETRRYIEHRLNRVGWTGHPSFDEAAVFQKIHQATGGIPRRVNLLCNRLLLSAFLENIDHIGEDHVSRIARELRSEVGETTVVLPPSPVPPAPAPAPAPLPAHAPALRGGGAHPELRATAMAVHRELGADLPNAGRALQYIVRNKVPADRPTVLCLVDSPAGYFKAALLAAQFERAEPPFRAIVVGCRSAQQLGSMENFADAVDLPSLEVHLGVDAEGAAQRNAEGVLRFDGVIDEFTPCLVAPLGFSDDLVSCALLAARRGVLVVRPDAGVRPPETFGNWRLNSMLLERIAGRLYAPDQSASNALDAQVGPSDRVQVTGSLSLDAMQAAAAADAMAQALLKHHGLAEGFVLVTSRVGDGRLSAASLNKLLVMLTRVRGDRQMLWLVCGETQSALRAQGLGTLLSRSGVALASIPVFSSRLVILQRASFLITDGVDDLVEVALALGKKVLLVDETGDAPPSGDESVAWLSFDADELGMALPGRDTQNPNGAAAAAIVGQLAAGQAAPVSTAHSSEAGD